VKQTRSPQFLVSAGGGALVFLGILLRLGWLQTIIIQTTVAITHIPAKATWPYRLQQISLGLLVVGAVLLFFAVLVWPIWPRMRDWVIDHFAPLGEHAFYSPAPVQPAWPKLNWVDWVCLACFLVYGLLLFISRIQGNFPQVMLVGDAANTASFAAGLDHPQLFAGDMVLGETRNLLVYSTFNVYFTRWLTPITGSYSLSLSLLIPIEIFANLVGFYLLGRILLSSRGWAVLLTLLLSFPLEINLGEYWGVLPDPVARFNFQAVLPFVLCMVLVWRNQPVRWPWIMLLLGLMFYLHPVSTPTWAATIWVTLLLSSPRRWGWWKRLGFMVGMGLIFLAVATPYIVTYLTNHIQGKSASYDLVYTVITEYFPHNLINIPAAWREFLPYITRPGIAQMAMVAALVLSLFPSRRANLLVVLSWIAGILLFAVLFPYGLHSLERRLHMIPAETELVRGVRYLIPLLLLLSLWALRELNRSIRYKPAAILASVAAGLLVLGWGLRNPPPLEDLTLAAGCLSQGKAVCQPPNDYEKAIGALPALTPPGSLVYATFANSSALSYAMPVRFLALRPLVYSNKDRGMLVYSNPATLQTWYDTYQSTLWISRNYDDPNVILKRHITLAGSMGAEYVFTELDFQTEKANLLPGQVLFRNAGFALIKLR
jgi:hypothetical protein